MRGKGLLEGEVLTLFRDNWEMSSHKARLDVGFGGSSTRKENWDCEGPGKEGCGEDSRETR